RRARCRGPVDRVRIEPAERRSSSPHARSFGSIPFEGGRPGASRSRERPHQGNPRLHLWLARGPAELEHSKQFVQLLDRYVRWAYRQPTGRARIPGSPTPAPMAFVRRTARSRPFAMPLPGWSRSGHAQERAALLADVVDREVDAPLIAGGPHAALPPARDALAVSRDLADEALVEAGALAA